MPPCKREHCGPCKLCSKKSSQKYFHLSTMQSEALKSIIKEACDDIEMNDCICGACRLKYSKKWKSSTYTPEKSRKKERNPCFLTHYMMYSDLSDRDCACTLESFNSAFSLNCLLIPTTIPLCIRHRRDLSRYEEGQSLSKCSVCEGLLKSDSKKYSCAVLSKNDKKELFQINDNFTIESDSILCQACYSYARRKYIRSKVQSFEELEKGFVRISLETDDGRDEEVLKKSHK